MNTIFWLAAAVTAFAYVGYPLCMVLQSLLFARWSQPRDYTPGIDVLLVVHNGAGQLSAKLSNLLALDYPPQALRINVVCDGCSDASESIARGFPSDRIRVFAFSERRGKSACIGNVLPLLDAEIILFNDVRQRIDAGAARALVAALADPQVGAASGELVLETSTGYGQGIDAYWRYEKLIRRMESASGSLIGATGALYAARRAAIGAVPEGVVLDDMWIPLGVAAAGYRVVFAPDALAYDQAATDAVDEERRKRRTLAGNYQLLHRWPQLAIPFAHPLALRLWGHKWLRLAVPWCLLLMLLSSAALAIDGSRFYQLLLLLQLAAYGAALLGRYWPATASRWLPVRICTAFFSLNFAAAMALFDYLRNPNAHLWRPTTDGVSAS
ncbi:glycosyltransferase family 2 protein [Pseudoxanthomonas yeongjuensis]|uniref:glycosyltransferase family 2 protein n=1 Tax=Pseudoxanthomonas yeongjuensis TaxID=377616 RepID=UPI001391EF62|nr:glycosyltransferase family 2 protein [Pseudoxanthomonas yeongjuensis]